MLPFATELCRLSLPVVEPVDDALGLRGARLPGEGHVRLEARKQRQHLESLFKAFQVKCSLMIRVCVSTISHVFANPRPPSQPKGKK